MLSEGQISGSRRRCRNPCICKGSCSFGSVFRRGPDLGPAGGAVMSTRRSAIVASASTMSTPAPAIANASRGLGERRGRAAEHESDPGHRAGDRPEQGEHAGLLGRPGQRLHGGDQRDPLDPVARAADERRRAGDGERRRRPDAEIREPDRKRRQPQEPAQRDLPQAGEQQASDDHARRPSWRAGSRSRCRRRRAFPSRSTTSIGNTRAKKTNAAAWATSSRRRDGRSRT